MPQEEAIDVLGYLRRLGKYLVPALVAGLVVAALLGVKALQSKPTYQEKAHVLVYPNAVTTEAQATQQSQLLSMMMRTYVALEDSPVFTKAVSDATAGKWTPQEVAADLTVFWGGGSNLLAFQATGGNRADTDTLANTAAEVFVAKAAEIAPNEKGIWEPKLAVVERSVEMTPPTSTKMTGLLTALGGGIATALLVMLVLEALAAARRRRPATAAAPRTAGGASSAVRKGGKRP